jgi:peptidoglycan/LPS O-acetylase OafA/YrhL
VLLMVLLRIPPYFGISYSTPDTPQLWSNLLLIQNITQSANVLVPLWSLPYEVQMYLALPFIYALGKRYGKPPLMVVASGVVWYMCRRFDLAWGLLTYLPWFVMGTAAYFQPRRIRFPDGAYYVAISLLVLTPIACWLWIGHSVAWIELGCGGLFAASLPGFPEIESKVVALVCHYIAKYSYGIYLAHVPVLLTLQQMAAMPVVMRIGACTCLLVVVPVILYYVVENPMIKIGGHIARRLLPGSCGGLHRAFVSFDQPG